MQRTQDSAENKNRSYFSSSSVFHIRRAHDVHVLSLLATLEPLVEFLADLELLLPRALHVQHVEEEPPDLLGGVGVVVELVDERVEAAAELLHACAGVESEVEGVEVAEAVVVLTELRGTVGELSVWMGDGLLYVGRLNGMVDFPLFLACLTFGALNFCSPLIRMLRTKRWLRVKTRLISFSLLRDLMDFEEGDGPSCRQQGSEDYTDAKFRIIFS